MKKAVVLGVIIVLAAPVFCQNTGIPNLLSGLPEGFGGGLFNASTDGGNIPFIPGLYMNRKESTYVTFGIIINNDDPQPPSPGETLKTAILFKAAVMVYRKKTNVTLFFDYYQNGCWGLNIRLKF